jgi:hypothetical protein
MRGDQPRAVNSEPEHSEISRPGARLDQSHRAERRALSQRRRSGHDVTPFGHRRGATPAGACSRRDHGPGDNRTRQTLLVIAAAYRGVNARGGDRKHDQDPQKRDEAPVFARESA